MNEEASAIVVAIATDLVKVVRRLHPGWNRAYFRFRSEQSRYGGNGSCVVGNDVFLFDMLANGDFFTSLIEAGLELLNAIGKEHGVFVIKVDSTFHYEVKFEFEDMERWIITKLDGKTGIPEGL